MDVSWLEQSEADVPAENDWLSAREVSLLGGMRIPKRRADWRLGRWTAKCAVAVRLNISKDAQAFAEMEMRPAQTGVPEVFLANKPASVVLSLSHRDGVAACAVTRSGAALGCDLEIVEPHSDGFIADFFTAEEQALVAQASETDRHWLLALLWSAKESALKALGEGLRLDTRCVIVSPGDALRRGGDDGGACVDDPILTLESSCGLDSWSPLRVRYREGRIFQGWWQRTGNLVRTLVADPPPAPPILLEMSTKESLSCYDRMEQRFCAALEPR